MNVLHQHQAAFKALEEIFLESHQPHRSHKGLMVSNLQPTSPWLWRILRQGFKGSFGRVQLCPIVKPNGSKSLGPKHVWSWIERIERIERGERTERSEKIERIESILEYEREQDEQKQTAELATLLAFFHYRSRFSNVWHSVFPEAAPTHWLWTCPVASLGPVSQQAKGLFRQQDFRQSIVHIVHICPQDQLFQKLIADDQSSSCPQTRKQIKDWWTLHARFHKPSERLGLGRRVTGKFSSFVLDIVFLIGSKPVQGQRVTQSVTFFVVPAWCDVPWNMWDDWHAGGEFDRTCEPWLWRV